MSTMEANGGAASPFDQLSKEIISRTHAVIFCDSAVASGLGHLMRCQALAAALRDLGLCVHYACEDTASFVQTIGRPMKEGFDLAIQTAEAASPKGLGAFINNMNSTKSSICPNGFCSLIIVDTYKVDTGFLTGLYQEIYDKGVNIRLCVLDDHQYRIGKGIVRLCPMQLMDEKADAESNLTGVEYLLMRPDFMIRQCSYAVEEERSGLVICLGGADTKGYTSQCIQLLQEALDSSTKNSFLDTVCAEVTVIASDRIANEQALDTILDNFNASGNCRRAIRKNWATAEDMANLFSTAASAIVSSSGVGCEAASMRCPSLVAVCWVDNQENHARVLQHQGVCVVQSAKEAVSALAKCETVLPDADWGIDALGAQRVAAELCRGQRIGMQLDGTDCSMDREGRRLHLRLANILDAEALLEWRNHEDVRQNCHSQEIITMSTHLPWLLRTLMNSDRILLVLEREWQMKRNSENGEKETGEDNRQLVLQRCGTCRIDMLRNDKEPTVELSWTIAPPHWGAGSVDGHGEGNTVSHTG